MAKLRLALGADHAGYALAAELRPWLPSLDVEVLDLGAHTFDAADDYPDFAAAVARSVAGGQAQRGLIVCGSGVGASVAANKVPGVRAAVCHDTYSAHQGVEHDDVNVLCVGGRIVGVELAKEIVAAFINARFSGEERHQRRLAKVMALEEASRSGPPPGARAA